MEKNQPQNSSHEKVLLFAILQKNTQPHLFSWEWLKNFQNSSFIEDLQTVASHHTKIEVCMWELAVL